MRARLKGKLAKSAVNGSAALTALLALGSPHVIELSPEHRRGCTFCETCDSKENHVMAHVSAAAGREA